MIPNKFVSPAWHMNTLKCLQKVNVYVTGRGEERGERREERGEKQLCDYSRIFMDK